MNAREHSKKPTRLFIHSFRYVLATLALIFASAAQGGTLYATDGRNLYSVTGDELEYEGPAGCDGLALSPAPYSFLYCASSGARQYDKVAGFLHSLSPTEGIARFVALINGDADRGLAYDLAGGLLYGTDNRSFGAIDPETGDFTPLADPPIDPEHNSKLTEPESLAADPLNGLIYGLGTNERLIAYDIATDTWQDLEVAAIQDGSKGGLAFDLATGYLYFLQADGKLYMFYPEDPTITTLVAEFDDFGSAAGLTYVPDLLPPILDIKANGSDDSVSTTWRNRRVTVQISLDARDMEGRIAEEWIWYEGPSGIYHYEFGRTRWERGLEPSYVGVLNDRLATEIRRLILLRRGSYEVNYGIDFLVNAVLDGEPSDTVSIDVQ